MVSAEATRLAALRTYRILDTDPERAFDDLALLASQICGTPIGLITIIDENRPAWRTQLGDEADRLLSYLADALATKQRAPFHAYVSLLARRMEIQPTLATIAALPGLPAEAVAIIEGVR